jgi:hypothetical protein
MGLCLRIRANAQVVLSLKDHGGDSLQKFVCSGTIRFVSHVAAIAAEKRLPVTNKQAKC